MPELRLARSSVRVANAVPPVQPPDPPDPPVLPPLSLSVVVVGFEHTITPGRWQSTLHTSTTTTSQ